MMNWNLRIIEHENRFGLYAVHYNEDGSPQAFRQEPAFVWDKDGSMEDVLEMMKAAANRPVLQYAEVPFGPRGATGNPSAAVVPVASGQ
jgi:hypothetical protein